MTLLTPRLFLLILTLHVGALVIWRALTSLHWPDTIDDCNVRVTVSSISFYKAEEFSISTILK